jgi:ubiquinone/menaquinone biosynthesis C-methylase UbiE
MPWQYSDEYYTEYTRTTWNESAAAYVDLMRNLEPFRVAVLSRMNPQPGEHILDMGTGPGEPALSIARAVAPKGRVTAIDLSEKMIEIARQVGKARGIENAEFRVMDCSNLDFPDSVFDAAVCCFGFQIFTSPEKAAAQAHRVLRPNGRIFTTVWSTGSKVPFLDVIIGPMLEHAEPDENGYLPTPYETGGPGEMVAFLEAAGFRNAFEHRVTHTMRYSDAESYLNSILKATPIGHSLSEEPPEVQEEVLRKTRANLQRWSTPEGIELPAECVIAGAEKPG